jgi:hypothetical protein
LCATKKLLENLVKWPEIVVILIKTISMAIWKSHKADVADNQPLSGNTLSLMIKNCGLQILKDKHLELSGAGPRSAKTQVPDDFGQKICSNN